MTILWTFLLAHWWLPFLVCIILNILLFIIDDTIIVDLFPVALIFAIGFTSTVFLLDQKYGVGPN
ncbi:hypothetical protein Desaci_4062 [Desulfosporosinus acidiphilus SJ4]|uniref:Uncharacterized protein n=1 Tax=Desulfosporosinus acidiphilus (strain DSM 22704 / JCM 16185 / SJ4) TaxID=646529 RepID=I4DAV2_DESAJ|nr:hypothetical protein Desaci_4062 [Desulfosporosinus acidiphilus SJ4]